MEFTTVAEQRATAVAKLKRAASLPRMKDGRRPPMHVEAVSEGERGKGDEDGTQDSDDKEEEQPLSEEATVEAVDEVKTEEVEPEKPTPPEAPSTPSQTNAGRKRRSRSRTRSRGSRDLKTKALNKQSPHMSSASPTNESSADEYANISAPGEDAPPPSPPLISPVPSHFPPAFPASYLLRSMSPPFLYPGTTPPTPLPTLDDLSKGMMGGFGLFRSNSAGAARALTMQKLLGNNEPVDMTFISPTTPPPLNTRGLARNNTVAGGERLAARKLMMHALGNRLREADAGEQTSAGEDIPTPTVSVAAKRRRRRSRRSSSRASTVVDDRDEREVQQQQSSIQDNPMPAPLPLSSKFSSPYRIPAASSSRTLNDEAEQLGSPSRTNGDIFDMPMGRRGPVVEDEDDAPARLPYPGLPGTPARNYAQVSGSRPPHASDAPSSTSTDSVPASGTPVPFFLSQKQGFKDAFPESPFATPLKEKVYPDDDEEQVLYQELHNRSRFVGGASYDRQSEISWVADPSKSI